MAGFDAAELARLSEVAAEARAVTNSTSLLGVLGTFETEEAGQRFAARRRRERRED